MNPDDGFALGAHAYRGAEHCAWQSVTFLNVAWPPGSITTSFDEVRQFVWDPDGALSSGPLAATGGAVQGSPGTDVELPADAAATGIHTDSVELWISPSDQDAIHVGTADRGFDRWPRAAPSIECE